jgi:hypothetical protein
VNQIKAQMLGDMARPGFQIIMIRLNDYADRLQMKYDTLDPLTDPTAIMHTQITRHLIKIGIPAILEEIMNEGEVEEPWTFKRWLRNILGERK